MLTCKMSDRGEQQTFGCEPARLSLGSLHRLDMRGARAGKSARTEWPDNHSPLNDHQSRVLVVSPMTRKGSCVTKASRVRTTAAPHIDQTQPRAEKERES